MKIGISIYLDALLGNGNGKYSTVWKSHFPSAKTLLSCLKKEGVRTVEIKLPELFSSDEIMEALRLLVYSDFDYTFHAPGCRNYPDGFEQYIQPMLEIARISNEFFQRKSLIVFHSLSTSTEIDSNKLLFQTKSFLNSIQQAFSNTNFQLALELLRESSNGKIRCCTTYDEVLKLVRHAGNNDFGICWDFGHGYAQAERGIHPKIPSDEFLKRVLHTHIHDYKNNITHIPLGHGLIPYQNYIEHLLNHGFKGVFNLELNPERIGDPENFRFYLVQSIRLLKLVLKGIESVN